MAPLTKLSRSIQGKIAIVTGAASGMGRATAHLLSDEGARLAIVDINEEALQSVEHEIRQAGSDVRSWVVDVGSQDEIATMVSEAAEHFGGIDILINNAGVALPTAVDAETYEENWARTLEINLTAHARFIRAVLPHLKSAGAGRIVNIASTEGLGATAGQSPYTASKHGVIGLTRSLAVELGSQGVTVNCICPGPIHTGMTAGIADDAKTKFARRRVPLRRYGDPEEVAQGTLSLVLPAASYINGAVLVVDGGMTAQNT